MLEITLYFATSMPYCSILFAQYEDIGATQVLYTRSAYIHFCVELLAIGRNGRGALRTGGSRDVEPGRMVSGLEGSSNSSDVWNLKIWDC